MFGISVRYASVAGGFYPGDEQEIRKVVNQYLSAAKEIRIKGRLRGFVVPHAGYIYSGPTAGFGYRLLSGFQKDIDNVYLLGPSHYANFYGVAQSGAELWDTPLGKVMTPSLGGHELLHTYPEVHAPEHCLEVQLPFLQMIFKHNFNLYPLLTGTISPAAVGELLDSNMDNKSVMIASSDLSHYYNYETAVKLDSIANKAVPSLDIKTVEDKVEACGKLAILTLMHIAKKRKWKGVFLDYRNSGDTAGDKIRVVGYGCYAFYE